MSEMLTIRRRGSRGERSIRKIACWAGAGPSPAFIDVQVVSAVDGLEHAELRVQIVAPAARHADRTCSHRPWPGSRIDADVGHARAAHEPGGQLGPAPSAVHGLVDDADGVIQAVRVGSAIARRVGVAAGVQDLRVGRIDRQRVDRGVHRRTHALLPMLPAILGAVHALVRRLQQIDRPGAPGHREADMLRVARIDDRGEKLGVAEAAAFLLERLDAVHDARPRGAVVGGLEKPSPSIPT